jgi:hypothetical protein
MRALRFKAPPRELPMTARLFLLTNALERRGVLLSSAGRCNAAQAYEQCERQYRDAVARHGHALCPRAVHMCMRALRWARRAARYGADNSATLRSALLPAMRRLGYDDTYAGTGDVTAAALLLGYTARYDNADTVHARFKLSLLARNDAAPAPPWPACE